MPTGSNPPPRKPDPIALVWIGGIALAVLAYAIGPDHVAQTLMDTLDWVLWSVSNFAHTLTASALQVMRAAAIGLLGVFVALSALSIVRTGRGQGALLVLTAAFLLLVWGASGQSYGANTRWLLALLVAAGGAVSVTNRLSHGVSGGWFIPGRRR